MEQNKTVFLSAPVSNRDWVISYYLRNLYNLDYNKKLISIFWVINNSKDDTMKLLFDFKNKYESEYESIRIEIFNDSSVPKDERTVEVREKYIYQRLADLRNYCVREFLRTNCDYFFSCDSDILIRKDCLSRLVSHEKDFCSALIYNGYLFHPEDPSAYPNILKLVENDRYKHIVNYRTKHPESNFEKPLIRCDFTGAVFTMSRKACSVVRYEWHRQGEDEPASKSIREAGMEIFCDVYNYNQHVMDEKFLEQFKSFGI